MRYLPHTDADRKAMLSSIGVNSIDDLFADIPGECASERSCADLPPPAGELEVERQLGTQWRQSNTARRLRFRFSSDAAPTSIMCRQRSIT